MMPVHFGAGRIVVDPSYLRKNDATEVADTVAQWREAVPDGVTITLMRSNGGGICPLEEGEREGKYAEDGVVAEGDNMGTMYSARRDKQSTRDLLDYAITFAHGDVNFRRLWQADPKAAGEILGAQFRDFGDRFQQLVEADMRGTWYKRMLLPFFNWLDRRNNTAAE